MTRPTWLIVPLLMSCAQEAVPIDESEKPTPPPVEGDVIPKNDKEAAPTPPAEEAPALDPVQTCNALVQAAKIADPEAFGAVSTDAAIEAMAQDEKRTEAILAVIGAARCGEATVQGDAATVSADSGEQTRDIPFLRVGGIWRFDGAAYLEKYPMEQIEKPSPRKAKKGKKRRRRRRKE